MRPRPIVLGAALLILALGAAGCTSSASPGTSPVNHPAAGASARPVTGTVVVKKGNKVVCVIKLTAGRGSCHVSTKDYAAGTVTFTGTYTGGDGFKPSKATANLTLKPAAGS
jgi:hypothetical protein